MYGGMEIFMKYTHKNNQDVKFSFDKEEFLNPKNEFFPYYTWVWSSKITKEGIVSRLDEYEKNNIKNVYILPEPKEFRPDTMPTSLEPDYLSKEYFELYRYASEYAESKGMGLLLYDEGGWPSGSACGKVIEEKPHLIHKTLSVRKVNLPYSPSGDAVACFYDGKRIKEGFNAEGLADEYYIKQGAGYYTDLLEPETTDTFIHLTHEQYKKSVGHLFGKTILASFTDEPSTSRTGWCDGFAEKFKKRYGYDVLDHLPVICLDKEEDTDEKGMQVRIDYTDLLAEVFAENYFMKLRSWCNENNLLSTGHLNGDDVTNHKHQGFHSILRQLRCLDIPGVDSIWRQIFPGNDNHFFPRFASSAANQIGSPYAITESFAIYGAGLTFDQMRYVILYQLTRGINIFNIMETHYSYDGVERRGPRPGFNPCMPIWNHLKDFNKYVARLSYLARLGEGVVSYAVYMPMRDIWAGGSRAKKWVDVFDKTVKALEKAHCSVDIIDDDFLETASVEGNALSTGTAKYTTLVMLKGADISESAKEKLKQFKDAGGKIIYDDELLKAEPVAEISSENVSLFKRILPNGVLYFLQNESAEEEKVSVSFFEKGNIYELKADSGEMLLAEHGNIVLKSGEEKIYFITDEKYDAKLPRKYTKGIITIDKLEMKRKSQFIIGEKGYEKHEIEEDFVSANFGDWCKVYGDDFSGEVIYKAEFNLDDIPESIEIDLGDVRYSCDVNLNGAAVKTLFAHPFEFSVDGKILEKKNTMLITVANTPANQYSSAGFLDEMPESEIGPYHKITKPFEKDSIVSGLMDKIVIRY